MRGFWRFAVVTIGLGTWLTLSGEPATAQHFACEYEFVEAFCIPSYESCMGGCQNDPRCLCFCGNELSACAFLFDCGTGVQEHCGD
jgi:hypothetical protein